MKTEQISKYGSSQSPESSDLEKRASELASSSKADNTKKAYKKDFDRFVDWCNGQKLDFLPATSQTVKLYITHLDETGRKPATITRVLASISKAHRLLEIESPTRSAVVGEVLEGIKRTRGTAQNKKKPILAKDLKKIIKATPPDLLGVRDKALLLIGWAGALRRSELVALDVEDLERVDDGLVITIRRSKTDQAGAGQKIAVPRLQSEFCPIRHLDKWLALSQISSGPIFCSVNNGGKNAFFYKLEQPVRLSKKSVALIIKKAVKRIGLNPEYYSGHSLRAGWTTAAAGVGAPVHIMKKHTRHRSDKMLGEYIRDAELFNDNPLPLLL